MRPIRMSRPIVDWEAGIGGMECVSYIMQKMEITIWNWYQLLDCKGRMKANYPYGLNLRSNIDATKRRPKPMTKHKATKPTSDFSKPVKMTSAQMLDMIQGRPIQPEPELTVRERLETIIDRLSSALDDLTVKYEDSEEAFFEFKQEVLARLADLEKYDD
jgi:hypothetical protein